MTENEIAQIITLARRAPLQNMAEAEAAAQLLQKLSVHFASQASGPEIAKEQAGSA
jgi:hypothetical protein